MNKHYILSIIVLLVLFTVSAQELENQLQIQYRQKIEYKQQVYEQILQTIRDNPDSDELDQFYFNLAELSCDIDQNDPAKTASYYKQVIRYNSSFSYKDIVYYNIAYFTEKSIIQDFGDKRQNFADNSSSLPDSLLFTEKLFKPAIDYYKRINEEFPQSPYNTEANWRLAELYYKIGTDSKSRIAFMRADDYYSRIIKGVDSQFYFSGMLGKVWAKFELSQYDSTFTKSIELINAITNSAEEINNSMIINETIDLLAWILVNKKNIDFTEGNIAVAQMELKLRDISDTYWQKRTIFLAGMELLNNNHPDEANNIFTSLLDVYPLSEIAPEIEAAKISLLRFYPRSAGEEIPVKVLISEKQDSLIDKYSLESEWYLQNKGKRIQPAIEVLKELLAVKEPVRFNKFLENSNRENYLKYKAIVNLYSELERISKSINPENEKRRKRNLVYCSQIIAQASDSADDFKLAIDALENYNSNYPDHPQYVEFSKNLFFCYEKLYRKQSSSKINSAEYDSLYIKASLKYENILRQDENWESQLNELAKVIFKRAEYKYGHKKYTTALEDYKTVTEINTEHDLIIDSWRRCAEISIMNEDFDEAEQYFRNALDYSDGYTRVVVFDNILSTIEKKAALLLENNQHDIAANEFLRLSSELQSVYPEKSLQFFSKAIDVYEEIGDDIKVKELLEFSSNNQTLDQTIALFYNTWQESDKLNDWKRSISLRNDFIQMYPRSNEAFRAKLQIIEIYETQLNQPETAAEMYLQLHDNIDRYDIGSEKPENIYLNALRIYQNLNNTQKTVELTNNFTESYPEYTSIDLNLTYNDTDDLQTLVRKLKKLKKDINYLFVAEEYNLMKSEIAKFREISSAVNIDSMVIDLNRDNARFDIYLDYSEYFSSLKNILRDIENDFLLKPASELIPVDKSTRWKENLVGGENSIGKLDETCDNYRNQIFTLLEKGKSYPLEKSHYTHALWAVAAVYDHAFKCVDQQIRNFVVKSNQLNHQDLQDNKYLQSELKRRLISEGDEYAFEFKLEAARFYQNILYNYYDGAAYSDLWTRKSLARLNEWGIREFDGDIVAIDEKMLLEEESYANEEIEQAYNEIYKKYQMKNYSDAYKEFMDFIDSYPGHSLTYNALYYAGESCYNIGELSKARDIFEKVLDFDKDKNPDALIRLGHYYNQAGNQKKAFAYWNRLINDYPEHYLAEIIQLTIAQIEAEEKEIVPQIAVKDISDDRKIVLKYRKYMQYYKKGKFNAAEKGFKKFHDRYPEHELAASSLFMQAESHYKQKEFSDALIIYNQVIDNDRNNAPIACYQAGLIQQELGNESEKERYWRKLIDEYPDHYLVSVIADKDQKFASITPKNPIRKPVRKKSPNLAQKEKESPQYQYKSALVLYRYEDYPEAIEKMNLFIKNNPKNRLVFNARFILGDSYQKSEQYALAVENYEKILPVSGSRRPEVLINLAKNYIALENYKLAKERLQAVQFSYSGTSHAKQASELLDQIPGESNNEE